MQLWVVNKINKAFQRNNWGRSCCYGLCTLGFFSKWSSQTDSPSTLILQWQWEKLKLVKINWGEKTNEHDQKKCDTSVSACLWWKSAQSKEVVSFALFTSVYFDWWFEINFCRFHGSCFVVEMKIVSVANPYSAPSCALWVQYYYYSQWFYET